MQSFKELTIQKTPNGTLPQLPLNGKYLDDHGFTVGQLVSIVFSDSCLILTTNTTVKNHSSVLMVESKLIRKRPRTQLTIHGFLLKRYGLNIGDRVALLLMPNLIQITKINRYTTDRNEYA